MKKRLLILCMFCITVLSLPMITYAENTPRATFDGSTEIKYNYDDTTNFGDGFVNMMPGETRTQDIILDNTSEKIVDFYMRTETLKTFEEVKKTSGAAYQVMLTVTDPSGTRVIYGGTEEDGSSRIGADDQGLGNLNGNINEWFKVVTLDHNQQATITMKVSLDGESHTNSYMDAEGTFQFEFKAGYDDEDNVITIFEQLEDVIINEIIYANNVKTGESIVPLLLIGGIGICIVLLIVVLILKKREKEEAE